ncbi:MAG: hypothetical protein HFG70_16480 [Hungatella sp.]|nr:hypothetical protein [Hungatella sp.]
MKKFDGKSFAAGVIFGTLGISTAFAATGIKSAVLSDTAMTLNGASLSLGKSLVSITMEGEQAACLYVPADEAFKKLGYGVSYDMEKNTLNLIPGGGSQAVAGSSVSGDVVMDLANHANQRNIAESGSFQAEREQILVISVTSDLKGGAVDLFLFDPSGKEQRITIGSSDMTKEIPLEKGTWQYNCSGMFKEGGNVRIVGTIK